MNVQKLFAATAAEKRRYRDRHIAAARECRAIWSAANTLDAHGRDLIRGHIETARLFNRSAIFYAKAARR